MLDVERLKRRKNPVSITPGRQHRWIESRSLLLFIVRLLVQPPLNSRASFITGLLGRFSLNVRTRSCALFHTALHLHECDGLFIELIIKKTLQSKCSLCMDKHIFFPVIHTLGSSDSVHCFLPSFIKRLLRCTHTPEIELKGTLKRVSRANGHKIAQKGSENWEEYLQGWYHNSLSRGRSMHKAVHHRRNHITCGKREALCSRLKHAYEHKRPKNHLLKCHRLGILKQEYHTVWRQKE